MKLYNLLLAFEEKELGTNPPIEGIIGKLDWDNPDFIYNQDRTIPLPAKVVTYGLHLKKRSKANDFIYGQYGNIGHVVSDKVKKILVKLTLDSDARFIDIAVRHQENDHKYHLFFIPYSDKYFDFENCYFVKAKMGKSSIIQLGKGHTEEKLKNLHLERGEKLYMTHIVLKSDIIIPDIFTSKTMIINKIGSVGFGWSNHFISEKLKIAFEKEKISGVNYIEVIDHPII